jgi:hypothetical protein
MTRPNPVIIYDGGNLSADLVTGLNAALDYSEELGTGPLASSSATWGATATLTLTDRPQLVTATLTASTLSALTISGLSAGRWAVLEILQPAVTGQGTLTINTQPVPVNTTANSVTTVFAFTDGTNIDVVSSASSTGGTSSGVILDWAAGTTYALGQATIDSGKTYLSTVAHTAGSTFASDFAANKWKRMPGQSRQTRVLTYSANPLAVGSNLDSLVVPVASKIIGVSATTNSTSVTVDLNLGGITVFTTQANRPAPTSGGTFITSEVTPDITAIPAGSKLSMDIDAAGSPGGSVSALGANASISNGNFTFPVACPATVTAGQLLVAAIGENCSTSGGTITPPSGWTIASGPREFNGGGTAVYISSLWFKIADGTEGGTSPIWTFSGNTPITKRGQIVSYDGPVTPQTSTLDVAGSATSSFGTTHTAPSVTTTAAGDLRVSYFTFLAGATVSTTPSGANVRGNINMFDRIVTSAGSSGTDVVTTAASTVAVMTVATFKTTTIAASGSDRLQVLVRMEETS